MRRSWLLCVLTGAMAWAQAAAGGPPPQSSQAPGAPQQAQESENEKEKDTASSVPANAAVITITGVCDAQAKTTATAKGAAAKSTTTAKTGSSECKTVITKAQCDQILNCFLTEVVINTVNLLLGEYVPNTAVDELRGAAIVAQRLFQYHAGLRCYQAGGSEIVTGQSEQAGRRR